jgi:hypothetical protein
MEGIVRWYTGVPYTLREEKGISPIIDDVA